MSPQQQQQMNNTAEDSFFGDLESLSSGMQSSTGISLNTSVRNFIEGNPRARNAQASSAEAETQAATLAYQLYQWLRKDGFDVDVLQCRGFKGKLVGCSPAMEEAIRELGQRLIAQDMIHYVVQVGNIVLDLAFRRLGNEYLHSNNTVYNQFKHHWVIVHVLAPRALTTPSAFLQAARAALAMTNLKKAQARLDHSDDWTKGFGVVTAADVANAFQGARRRRRIRTVATASSDPSLPKGVSRIRLVAVASAEDTAEKYRNLLVHFRNMFKNGLAPIEGMMNVVNEWREPMRDICHGLAFTDLPDNVRRDLVHKMEGASLYSFGDTTPVQNPTRSQQQALNLYEYAVNNIDFLGRVPQTEQADMDVAAAEAAIRRFFQVIDLCALLYEGSQRLARSHYQSGMDQVGDLLPKQMVQGLR